MQQSRAEPHATRAPHPLVDAVCEELERRVETDSSDLLIRFARIFLAKAPPEFFQDRSVETTAAATLGAFRFLEAARYAHVDVQVFDAQPEVESWSAPVTVIRTNVSERPFVVDTIREYLHAKDLAIGRFVYPVLRVVRDAKDTLLDLSAAAEGEPRESLVHCEVPRIEDPEQIAAIRADLESNLQDVVRATEDFAPMLEALDDTTRYLEECADRLPVRAEEIEEIQAFLRWLKEGAFVFLGYRGYDLITTADGERMIVVEPGSGLGILRNEGRSGFAAAVPLADLSPGLRERVEGGPLLITSKTNALSSVHRRARMDYIGVKKIDDDGKVTGERRFIGLFTSKAYAEDAERIPILRRKLRAILQDAGVIPGSHDHKEIITIFNSLPKEELFLASAEEIGAEILAALALYHTHEVKVTIRPDPLERGVSIMAILPKEKFSGEVRKEIEGALVERLEGEVLNYHLSLGGGDQARLHFYIAAPSEHVAGVSSAELEQIIRDLIRSWTDRVREGLEEVHSGGEAKRLTQRYSRAFSAEYRAATEPSVAEQDILELEAMERENREVAISFSNPPAGNGLAVTEPVTHLKLFLRGERLVLSDFMPILDNLGLRVLAVSPFEVIGPEVPDAAIYLFAVQDLARHPLDLHRVAGLLSEAILAVRAGDATNDPLNSLLLTSGLAWREVDVLRAYSEFAFQLGAVPSRVSLLNALRSFPSAARLLLRLFAVKFEPDHGLESVEGAREAARIQRDFVRSLENVTSLADDRALRRLLNLIDATIRTNYYARGGRTVSGRSGGVPFLSLKFSGEALQGIARTRLLAEVWVHSSRMAGVHLRGARVARGGIRHSDRPDDFRTEVLGLVKTQTVKNAVIVPAGSKGGFIVKRPHADAAEMAREVADQYRTLIRGLLDITDNLVGGELRRPEGVIAYDGPDPYLVVAADKGTAHLSDAANEVAAEYDFWLGDAFASGGSHGYDHKAVGITARGAWECVKRHFREMGRDIQSEPFSAIGIGDMSGDVFGNGMLLSRQTRLVAAFDHRHIFLDPNPDPEVSYRERQRLFEAGRTSWADYRTDLLSEGGFVVPRSVKEVELPPRVQAALGITVQDPRMDGESLIRAILSAPADLLWNGGIGTYVKAPGESHGDVGDSANDAVRIDADTLRVKVVGEGGNLGLTQRARVRYALAGGRLNTDAIDNAGGVDLSDREVNLKILLTEAVAAGSLEFDRRNRLLAEITPEVTRLVLEDNSSQSLAISLDELRSAESIEDFQDLLPRLERDAFLDRSAEGLPTLEELSERRSAGKSFTRPELAILLAYAKLDIKRHLLGGTLPDEPAAEAYLGSYFPAAALEAASPEALHAHRLRREIIVSQITNDMVDLMGAAFVHRVCRDTGSSAVEVARAWLIASQLSGARGLRESLGELEAELPTRVVYRWLFGLARVLERTTRWVLGNVAADAPTSVVIDEHLEGLGKLREEFGKVVAGEERRLFQERVAEIQELTDKYDLAQRLITLRFLDQLLEILRVARETQADPVHVGRAYYLTSELLRVPSLRIAIFDAAGDGRWDQRLAQALAEDIGRAHRHLTAEVVAAGEAVQRPEELLSRVREQRSRELAAYRKLLEEVMDDGRPRLAALAIVVRELQNLAARP